MGPCTLMLYGPWYPDGDHARASCSSLSWQNPAFIPRNTVPLGKIQAAGFVLAHAQSTFVTLTYVTADHGPNAEGAVTMWIPQPSFRGGGPQSGDQATDWDN